MFDVDAAEFGAAERADEPDEQQDVTRNPPSDFSPLSRVVGVASRIAHNRGGMIGNDCSGGAPWVRRMPSHTVDTIASSSCDVWPAACSTKRIDDSRRDIVPTLAPCRARLLRYLATATGSAGIGSIPCAAHQDVHSAKSDR